MKLNPYLIASSLLSVPTLAVCDVGDVYYCQTEVIASIESGTVEQYKSQRFTFKWEEQNRIQFGGGDSYFENAAYEITLSYPSLEFFSGSGPNDVLSFHKGRLRFSRISLREPTGRRVISEITSILASCDKF